MIGQAVDAVDREKGKYSLIRDVEDFQMGAYDKPLPCFGCGIGWFSWALFSPCFSLNLSLEHIYFQLLFEYFISIYGCFFFWHPTWLCLCQSLKGSLIVFSFLLGILCPLMWYYATILYFGNYYRKDPRERAGLAASAIAVSAHLSTYQKQSCIEVLWVFCILIPSPFCMFLQAMICSAIVLIILAFRLFLPWSDSCFCHLARASIAI